MSQFLKQYEHNHRQMGSPGGLQRPHPLTVRKLKVAPPRLRADQLAGAIYYGDQLLLSGIPAAAWRYRLGNRSALEWVLDQYQERTPKDPTIRAQFDTYRLADHLAEVSELLAKVATVSVETMAIVDRLAASSPLNPATPTPMHQVPAPATPAAARQLLLDFSQPARPLAPPETFTLRLHRGQSDFYLEYDNDEHGTTALKYLLEAFGHEWDVRVKDYLITEYWQGPKNAPDSWVAVLVVQPCPLSQSVL